MSNTNFERLMSSIKKYVDDMLKRYLNSQEENLKNYPKKKELGKVSYTNKYEDLYGIPEIPSIEGLASQEYVDDTLGRLVSEQGKVTINYSESNGELVIKMGENSSSIVEYNKLNGNLTIIE